MNELVYSHRNGETDKPEIKGWYWTYCDFGQYVPPSLYVHFFDGKEWDNPAAVNFMTKEFYGPIPTPVR